MLLIKCYGRYILERYGRYGIKFNNEPMLNAVTLSVIIDSALLYMLG